MRTILLIGCSILLSGCIGIDGMGDSDRYTEDFHYSWDISANGRVRLENTNGGVEVMGWDQNKVDISGTKFGSTEQLRNQVKINIDHQPDFVDIRTSRPAVTFGGSGARYVIHVPRTAMLDKVETTNGSVRVTGIEGGVRVKSTNGSITAEHVGGEFDARTTNGRVTARIDDAGQQPVRVHTTNGSVDLEMANGPKSDLRVDTTNGSITARMPGGITGRLRADTSTGSVTSDFDFGTQHEHQHGREKHIEGSIGSGGPTMEFSTHNGSIHIQKMNR